MALELLKLQLIYHNLTFKKVTLIKLFLLATTMASIPCLNRLLPIDACDPSWTIEATKVRLNASDLDAAFRDLMAANWLVDGYETLSIGRDSARAVMVLKKLGFADAMGLYRSCASLFRNHQPLRALPFSEGSFDFVISTEMIDGVRVPARLVLEMERVLKPARIGVVMRRVSGNFPVTAIMKAAAPVAAFLRFSDVVAVRTVNCTVMVVFRKTTTDGREKQKVMEQENVTPVGVITKKSLDSAENDIGSTYATLKKKLPKAAVSVARKSLRIHAITEMSRDFAITEMPRKSAPNYVAATLRKMLIPPYESGKSTGNGNAITEMPRVLAGSHLAASYATYERYLLNMPPFGTKKRNVKGG